MGLETDWNALAKSLGTLRPNGEVVSVVDAQRAAEILVGEERLREAVDYYVSLQDGFELARAVLTLLRPWSAMTRCFEIFKSDEDVRLRRSAVELLRTVADRRALAWVDDFLNDPDREIQGWGVGVLDQLLFAELVSPEEVESLLAHAEAHSSEHVREGAAAIRKRQAMLGTDGL